MSEIKRPSFQFYPKDWLTDWRLKAATFEEKGFLIDLMCLAHDSPKYGYITKEMEQSLPQLLGKDRRTSERLLAKVREKSLMKVDGLSGELFNGRMVKDEETRNARAAGGSQGASFGKSGKAFGKLGGRPSKKPPLYPPPSSSSSSSSPLVSKDTPPSPNEISEITEHYEKHFETKLLAMSPQRRVKVKSRIKTFGIPNVKKAIENFAKSGFYRGENDREWKADFDWIIRSDENIEKGFNLSPKPSKPKVDESLARKKLYDD